MAMTKNWQRRQRGGRERVSYRLAFAGLSCMVVLGLAVLPAAGQPANDNFDEAYGLFTPQGSTNGTLVGSTVEMGEPLYNGIGANSVWYEWRAASSGVVTFDALGR